MTVTDIILLWADPAARAPEVEPAVRRLAGDIGVKHWTAVGWVRRGSIPGEYWAAILDAARDRGIELTADDLVEAAAMKRKIADDSSLCSMT